MFYSMTGEFRHNIDSKGRLIIPSKFRDALGSKVYITIGNDGCLSLFSVEEFEKFSAKLEQIKTSSQKGRMIRRFYMSNTADCDLDSQGRIIIPNNLKERAGLKKEVVIAGNGEKAEIWDSATYDSIFAEPEYSQESIDEMIEEMDINL